MYALRVAVALLPVLALLLVWSVGPRGAQIWADQLLHAIHEWVAHG